MPNKPRPDNPARPVRIDNQLWAEIKAIAAEKDTSASAVVREALRNYVERNQGDNRG